MSGSGRRSVGDGVAGLIGGWLHARRQQGQSTTSRHLGTGPPRHVGQHNAPGGVVRLSRVKRLSAHPMLIGVRSMTYDRAHTAADRLAELLVTTTAGAQQRRTPVHAKDADVDATRTSAASAYPSTK